MKPLQDPLFNIPPFVVVMIAVFVAIHTVQTYLLPPETRFFFALNTVLMPDLLLGGTSDFMKEIQPSMGEDKGIGFLWHTIIAYPLFERDWSSLFWNMVWLLIFATPLARSLSWVRLLGLFMIGVVLSAVGHLLVAGVGGSPLMGTASGVATLTGASMRMLSADNSFGQWSMKAANRPRDGRLNLAPLNSSTLLIFSVIWMALRMYPAFMGHNYDIWYSHIVGYVVGVILIEFIQPPTPSTPHRKSRSSL